MAIAADKSNTKCPGPRNSDQFTGLITISRERDAPVFFGRGAGLAPPSLFFFDRMVANVLCVHEAMGSALKLAQHLLSCAFQAHAQGASVYNISDAKSARRERSPRRRVT